MTVMRRAATWAGLVAVLAIVFVAYLQPDMAMSLALQLWACF